MPSFKIDENLPVETASLLKRYGHEAQTVNEERLAGGRDERLSEICRREKRVLMSLDLDFADIRTYPPARSPGMIVLRLASQDKPHILAIVEQLAPLLIREPIEGRLWIVDEGRVRIHGPTDAPD